MESLTLKEIQNETLKLLLIFDSICKKINVQYFLMWGSLIGVIRHKGFIPWDDDLDVMMKRKDFDKLIKYLNSHDLGNIKLASRENTKNYEYNIPRIYNSNFIYKTTLKNQKEIELGIFIDIYPLDNYGNSKKNVNIIYKKIHKYKRNYYIYIGNFHNEKQPKKFLMSIQHKLLNWIYQDNYCKKIENKTQAILKKYTSDNDRYVGVATWDSNIKPYYFKKELFNEIIYQDFENIVVPIPKQFDEILKSTYGDYMQYPPKDLQKPSHNYMIFKKKVGE